MNKDDQYCSKCPYGTQGHDMDCWWISPVDPLSKELDEEWICDPKCKFGQPCDHENNKEEV